jgi:hypothetical protein
MSRKLNLQTNSEAQKGPPTWEGQTLHWHSSYRALNRSEGTEERIGIGEWALLFADDA